MAALPYEVDDRPVVFASLKVIKGQLGEFTTAKSTAQQNGEQCSIALSLEGVAPWQPPKGVGLVGSQPVAESDTQFPCSPDPTYARGEFRAE